MRRTKRLLALVTGVVMLGMVAEAGAADFSPTIEFTLGDTKALGNPDVRALVKQDQGEEELQSVELKIPAGFTLAVDQQLQDGEKLGAGSISIHAGPRCRGVGPASSAVNLDVTFVEQNRTSAQVNSGIVAVYVIRFAGNVIQQIPLEVRGNPDKGYTLFGLITPNDNTCPPFTFDARFQKKAEQTGTPIFTNPQFGGDYKFGATFKSTANPSSTSESEQVIKIDGPAGGGGGSTLSDAEKRKKCKRIKNKQRRRKCLRRLRG